MKHLSYCVLSALILSACGPGFKPNSIHIPTDLEAMQLQMDQLTRTSLVKEMKFDSTKGLMNSPLLLQNEVVLSNPNNEDQYVDTGMSIQNYAQSTISVWFKANDVTKIEHIFWQGVTTQNGWGSGSNTPNESELNVTLNHWSMVNGSVIAVFLGYNEQALLPDLLPVSFPTAWNQTTHHSGLIGNLTTLDTSWHNLVVTIDNRSTEIEIQTYYDGNLLNSGTGKQTDISHWNSTLRLGRAGQDHFRNFDGKLKEFMMFDKVLSKDDVSLIYKLQKPTALAPDMTQLVPY